MSLIRQFSRTKHGADKIAKDLNKQGIPAAAIHGNKSQSARVAALEGFKAGDNGLIGRAAGFDVYRSTLVPNSSSTEYKVIAGHRSAWSKAEQILETEAYRPEKRFADALKGLHVYGAKVVRPSNLAYLVATDA